MVHIEDAGTAAASSDVPSPRTPQIGFFFWPFTPQLVDHMGQLAEEHGFDMVGVADTPGQAMDTWVSATRLAAAAPTVRLSSCVTNFTSRHWTTTGSAAASLAKIHQPGFVLGMGSGHSAVRNFGLTGATVSEMDDQLDQLMPFVRGEAVPNGVGQAQLPWVQETPRVFLAASHERSLRVAGAKADGAFINYGLYPDTLAQSLEQIRAGEELAGRTPGSTEVWQVAGLDCAEDGDVARAALGKMVAFVTGYVVGKRDPAVRGVPPELSEPIRTLVESYSTRPSQLDTDLVRRLGLFDYLSGRFAIGGDPDECLAQVRVAVAGGATRLMLSVSGASDPVRSVDLFGRHVLPQLRAEAGTDSDA